METSEVVSWHVIAFKVYGLWSPTNKSISYNVWSVMVIIFIFILHSIFKLSSVFFVTSIDDIIHILLMASAVVTISIKASIAGFVRNIFTKLVEVMKEMDRKVQLSEYQTYLEPLVKQSKVVFKYYNGFSVLSWASLILQLMVTPPEGRIYPSTFYYPYASMKTHLIYLGGLVYEAAANLLIIPIFVTLNLFGIMLMCTLIGYINILCERLRSIGNENMKDQRLEMVNICKMYIGITSYTKLLEKLLSKILFVQFGVSGIILCICSYQISKISISEDLSTFVFSLTYIVEMLMEILIPSYFGSSVFMKGEEIPYAAFQSNWIESNKDVKQSLRILLFRSMQPIQIRSAKTFILNLATMLKILKVAYSLLAVLNSMN